MRTPWPGLLTAAESVGNYAAQNAVSVSECDPEILYSDERVACVDTFIRRFSRLAYRRPPTESEVALLKTVFNVVEADSGFQDAIGAVVELALQSPQFFYLYEAGLPDSTSDETIRQLSGFEVATRLSLFYSGHHS